MRYVEVLIMSQLWVKRMYKVHPSPSPHFACHSARKLKTRPANSLTSHECVGILSYTHTTYMKYSRCIQMHLSNCSRGNCGSVMRSWWKWAKAAVAGGRWQERWLEMVIKRMKQEKRTPEMHITPPLHVSWCHGVMFQVFCVTRAWLVAAQFTHHCTVEGALKPLLEAKGWPRHQNVKDLEHLDPARCQPPDIWCGHVERARHCMRHFMLCFMLMS